VGTVSEEILKSILDLLHNGLKTHVDPVPETYKEFADILHQIQLLDAADIKGKLIAAGIVGHSKGPENRRCIECVYHLVHRKHCELLAIPVKADWNCRLWRT
jgi:hypothetical protein